MTADLRQLAESFAERYGRSKMRSAIPLLGNRTRRRASAAFLEELHRGRLCAGCSRSRVRLAFKDLRDSVAPSLSSRSREEGPCLAFRSKSATGEAARPS